MKNKKLIIRKTNMSKYGLKNYFHNAFTLIELIVVIIVLAILATIAFLSYNDFSSNSRDGVRLSDVSNIAKGLVMYYTINGKYPVPENNVILYSGSYNIGYQGKVKETTLKLVKISANSGIDPLDKSYYSYNVNTVQNKYQITGYLENKGTMINRSGFNNTIENIFPSLNANTYTNRFPYIKGDTIGIILDTSGTGASKTYTPIDDYGSGIDITNTGQTVGKVVIIDNTNTSTGVSANVLSSYTSSGTTLYSSCSGTTYSGYTITTLNHSSSNTFFKTISNGTGSINASCNDGVLIYSSENLICNSGYVGSGSICVANVCNGSIPTNGSSNASSQSISSSWSYNTVAGVCTYICNTYYSWNGSSCVANSWVQLGDWSSCSVSCGGGTQTQTVQCRNYAGSVIADVNCSGTKPSISQSCNTQSCASRKSCFRHPINTDNGAPCHVRGRGGDRYGYLWPDNGGHGAQMCCEGQGSRGSRCVGMGWQAGWQDGGECYY